MSNKKPIVGISCGDLNGIGMEVIIKTFADSSMLDFCTPVVFASGKVVSYHRKALGVKDFSFNIINNLEDHNPKRSNLYNIWNENIILELGTESEAIGTKAIESVDAACQALSDGKIDVLVTAPLNKNTVKLEGKNFSGHTEYLADKLGGSPLMILFSEDIKVALVTGHIPLNEVAANISVEKILEKLELLDKSLKMDFGIRKPKIAVMGLNPHSGDGGLLGTEEIEVIGPAIEAANAKNILCLGPYSSDGFFGSGQYADFDAVLAMYHDQGLLPFKTISFENGVNYTAGLNYIRTSPDHGTGYGIAGKNVASESSFRNAVFEAINIHRSRSEYQELNANPLPVRERQNRGNNSSKDDDK